MIGRLLQSAASTFSQHGSSRPQTPLESVTEEAHTRDLLFPETQILRSAQQNGLPSQGARPLANAREAADYDDRGGLDVVFPGDIRLILAQDANSRHHQPQVLYDSKPPQTLASSASASPLQERGIATSQYDLVNQSKATSSPVPTSSRRRHTPSSSIFQSPQSLYVNTTSPRSPESRFRSFGEGRSRSSPFEPPVLESETTQARVIREVKEETEALLGCMFGAPGFRIEPGTKVHMLPRKTLSEANGASESPNTARPFSSGGSMRKRTPLMRSTSVADMSNDASVHTSGSDRNLAPNTRACIMFTKLFAVNLLDSSTADAEERPLPVGSNSTSGEPPLSRSNGYGAAATQTTKNVKQIKVPMYAISVILQLPVESHHVRLRSNGPRHALSSLGSSFNEVTPAASWNTENSMFSRYMEMRSNGSLIGSETFLNGNVSYVLTHWHILCRSLKIFEAVAKIKLRNLLELSIPIGPLISAAPTKVNSVKIKQPKQPTQQSVHVQPGCLQLDSDICKEAEKTSQRIISGLRIRRVATGQGRWGAWREEARWVGRWAGGRDQNFFFFNFLTAFLGHNTSWLEVFGSSWLRHRHAMQHHINDRSSDRLHQRTVIISADKMAARRLIFLLAAFLPGTYNSAYLQAPPSPYPAMLYSESPPSMPVVRDRSLRRTINSRPCGVHKSTPPRDGHARSVSFSLMGTGGHSEDHEDKDVEMVNRRMSDAKSPRPSSMANRNAGGETRKASFSTIVAESAVPVPHFASLSVRSSAAASDGPRPGSSGSLASIALTHTLKRSDSTAFSTSGSAGRWGSVVSGFWSNRRGSSTDGSEALGTSQEGTDVRIWNGNRKPLPSGKLAQMVEEVSNHQPNAACLAPGLGSPATKNFSESVLLEEVLKSNSQSSPGGASAAKSIPQKRKTERMPLKLSINEDDGYIDIELPQTRSFTSSMESSFNSSRHQHQYSGSFHDHYSPYGIPSTPGSPRGNSEPTVDVAGWLKNYHPDFSLQAVRPYETLKAEIKQSMRAEACLETNSDIDGNSVSYSSWTDVCTTLIADTNNYSIQRLTLCRRRIAPSAPMPPTPTAENPSSSYFPTTIQAPNAFEERFIEEPLMDMDSTLIDAVERVLAQSGPSSRAPSPSRAASVRSARTASRPSSVRNGTMHTLGVDHPTVELPHSECKKMVLGALEEVVRSVFAEQRDLHEDEREGRRRGREMPDSTLREGVRKWLQDVDDF